MARSAESTAGRWRNSGLSLVLPLIATWVERHRGRRALRLLDDHMLKDVGLSRRDVDREADKPFWRS